MAASRRGASAAGQCGGTLTRAWWSARTAVMTNSDAERATGDEGGSGRDRTGLVRRPAEAEQQHRLRGRHGPREVVALGQLASHPAQRQELCVVLDAFGHCGQTEALSQLDD